VVFPDYSLEMINNLPSANGLIYNLWITSCFCIGRLHNTYWWSWILPFIFGFFAAVIFAGLILEMTKAFIKGSVREWLP
jgi:hypothetical protein